VNKAAKDYLIVELYEVLVDQENELSKRFVVFKSEERSLSVGKDKLSLELHIETKDLEVATLSMKDVNQLISSSHRSMPKCTRKKWSVAEIYLDYLFKHFILFLDSRKIISLDQKSNTSVSKYLQNRSFNESLNINLIQTSNHKDLALFIDDISLLLNENIISFFKPFLKYGLFEHFYDLKMLPSVFTHPIYHKNFSLLNASKHLSLQRLLLPFKNKSSSELRLGVLTWNIAGKNLKNHLELIEELVSTVSKANLDVISIGFQEIVELKLSLQNITSMAFKCESISKDIKNLFLGYFQQHYTCISAVNLMGLLQLVFIRRELVPKLDWHFHSNWNLKLGGKGGIKVGNKGCVSSVFALEGIGKISLTNCHLAHGLDNLPKRMSSFEEILKVSSGNS
jgi:hypothetical protein